MTKQEIEAIKEYVRAYVEFKIAEHTYFEHEHSRDSCVHESITCRAAEDKLGAMAEEERREEK